MATFKVGQRVRVIRAVNYPHLIGREATVIGGLTQGRSDLIGAYAGYPVDIDGFGAISQSGVQIVSPPDWLAPLTDPGCESFLQAMRDYANKQRTPVDVLRELHGEYL
jgi:hypothetical protein